MKYFKMKLLLSIILLCVVTLHCKSQYAHPQEIGRRDKLISDCNCPNQVFNTDSVYNFFQSDFLEPYSKKRYIFIIDGEPIPSDTVFYQSARQFFFENLRYHYEEINPYRKEEIISPKTLQKMFVAALDPTTRYTEPIVKWNVARMGKEWMNQNSYNYFDSLIIEKIEKKIQNAREKDKKNYKKYTEGLDVYIFANEDIGKIFIKTSVPVFDDEYKYAFVMINLGGWEHYGFALFKRNEQGWAPIRVMRDRYKSIESDFRDY